MNDLRFVAVEDVEGVGELEESGEEPLFGEFPSLASDFLGQRTTRVVGHDDVNDVGDDAIGVIAFGRVIENGEVGNEMGCFHLHQTNGLIKTIESDSFIFAFYGFENDKARRCSIISVDLRCSLSWFYFTLPDNALSTFTEFFEFSKTRHELMITCYFFRRIIILKCL